ELHPETVGQRLHRGLEVQALGLHDEVERVPGLLAAEAVVVLLVGPHVKGPRALIVKRADPEVAVDPGAAQLGAGTDQRQHVDRGEDAVLGLRRVAAHWANEAGTVSRSKARM